MHVRTDGSRRYSTPQRGKSSRRHLRRGGPDPGLVLRQSVGTRGCQQWRVKKLLQVHTRPALAAHAA
jgi:hypothetical protein